MILRARYVILLIVVSAFSAAAQPKHYPDSIRIEVPDHQSFMIFEMRHYTEDKSFMKEFPKLLEGLSENIKRSTTSAELTQSFRVEVVYSGDKEKQDQFNMKLYSPAADTTTVIGRGQIITQLLPPGWELRIRHPKAEVVVYSPDFARLEQLSKLTLDPVITSIDAKPESLHEKTGIISRIILSNGQVTSNELSHRNTEDMLGLHPGAGVGLLQDRLYPEFNFMTAIYLSSRFRSNVQRIAATYELKFFSGRSGDGQYQSWPNSFVSLSYGRNFGKDKPRWTALGVGLLVHSKGDLFTGNTMKIFLETDIGSQKLNIVPELYLTDDFKKTMFGVKLNYKF